MITTDWKEAPQPAGGNVRAASGKAGASGEEKGDSTRQATLLVGLACALTLLVVLLHGREGFWYALAVMIHRPQMADSAFGYRLLFPMLARFMEFVVPRIGDHAAFVAEQTVIIAVITWLSGEWTNLFLPRFGRMLGYVLLTVMLVPTMNYWTFYDLAIVGFWTACLWLLYRERWIAFLPVFGVAVLNHENILLIVPVALLYAFGRMRPSRLVLFAVAQFAIFAGLRFWVTHTVHGAHQWDNHLRDNIFFWRAYSLQRLVYAWAILIPWWLLAWRGWRHAPAVLRCGCVALPGLLLVAFIFGRIEEARLFDAFIPVCLGLIACWLRYEAKVALPRTDKALL